MADLAFIVRVAVLLLTDPGPAWDSWRGRHQLNMLVSRRLGADPAAAAMLAAAAMRPRLELGEILADTIRRVAQADPVFAAALRQLVVDAYAETGTAGGLPDPSPLLD